MSAIDVSIPSLWSSDAQVFIRGDVVTADMGGETVMMSVEQGAYFSLRGIGGAVWALLDQPQSVDSLVRAICSTHAVDESTCRADVRRFMGKLLDKGLARAAA